MHKLEMLLRKYVSNFLVLEDFPNNAKIEYLNFNNIIVITDTNLAKISSVKKVINYLQNNYNTKIIELSSGEPNYEMIESTSSSVAQATSPIISSVAGFSTAIVFPELLSIHLPLM